MSQGRRHTGLNPKMQAFVREYLIDFNGTQAAIRAGYSKKSAYSQACRLLKLDEVKRAVFEGRQAKSEQMELTREQTLEEAIRLVKADLRDIMTEEGVLLPPGLWPNRIARAIASVETEKVVLKNADGSTRLETHVKRVKLWSKDQALLSLMKHHGLFEEDHNQAARRDIKITKEMTLPEALTAYRELLAQHPGPSTRPTEH